MSDPSLDRNPLEALAEEFLERFRRGERPSLSEYTSAHPALAGEIRDLFPALVMLEDVRPGPAAALSGSRGATAGAKKLERLGDYRILREIGRGGMGIVYEAEQESLGRHVALKVLPAHALLEPRQLQRFQREARSAARLHHTNIVPVFGVGEEDGLHYYVMQFIHGQGLDQVLAVLQRLRQHSRGTVPDGLPLPAAPSADRDSVVAVARLLLTGVFAAPAAEVAQTMLRTDNAADAPEQPDPEPVQAMADVALPVSDDVGPAPGLPVAMSSSHTGQPYWHSVARIGIQVAEALAYAHAQGTLHRDIKPANLLLDTQGIVWVADFGLAKAVGSEDLTHTGDVVGTLRYMAPERFRGKADARSDVYGLGLTLYELLTLEPAFGESERDKLLLQVMHKEPPRPRTLNAAVPRDLETIVLKAIARDPEHRYTSAAELATDLQCFTEDKPIHARPVSEVEKLWRWCRRNPAVAVLASLCCLSLLLGATGFAWKWWEAEHERQHVVSAQHQTAVQRDAAITAHNESQQVLAGVLLDRGSALAEQGEVGEGLCWMVEALRTAPPEPRDLTAAIRANLTAWLEQVHGLAQVVPDSQYARRCRFRADGRQFLLAGPAGVQVWDSATCAPTSVLVKQDSSAALALSPDGRLLVTGHRGHAGAQAFVQRRDAATGAPLGPPLADPGGIRCVVFTPDGAQFISAGADGVVRRWDSVTGRLVEPTFAHAQRVVHEVAISPDGKTLAVATGVPGRDDAPAELVLWDLATGIQRCPPVPQQGAVHSVAFAPDGNSVLAGGDDRVAQLFDVQTGKPLGPPLRHSHPITVVRFAPDGRSIATGGLDGLIRWWDAASGAALIGTLSLQQRAVRDMAFSPDGKTLVAASDTHGASPSIHVFRLSRALARPPARGKEALARAAWRVGAGDIWFGRHVVSHSADATLALSGGLPSRAQLWRTATGQPSLAAGGPQGPLWHAWHAVSVTAISPDGRRLATSSRDAAAVGEARLWETATGQIIGVPLPHGNHVSSLEFSPNSQLLATGSYDDNVQFWDTATGMRRGAALRQPDIVLSTAFSPDGAMLAVGHSDNRHGKSGVVLWRLADRTLAVPAMPGPSHFVRFSPNGKVLLASSWPLLQLWDPATGKAYGPELTETAEINSAAFSPDSRLVVLSTTDGTVRLRAVPSGQPVPGAPMRNPFRANVAVFSPDGRLILAGYDDGSARLWDRATQKPIGPPVLHGQKVVAVSFSPDGQYCVTSRADGNTRRWPVPTPLTDDTDRLARRLAAVTGLTMGEGQTVVPVDAARWQASRTAIGAIVPTGGSDVEFHDARARDAEQEDVPFAARWHLDRLIAQPGAAPSAWLAYARRARTWSGHQQFAQADADYAAALKHGAPDRLLGWYRHRIMESVAAQNNPAALWYIARAQALAPDDWHLYADRAALVTGPDRDADRTRAVDHGAEAPFLIALADDDAEHGKWEKAAQTYALASERGRTHSSTWQRQTLANLKVGERARYQKLCARILGAAENAPSTSAANNAAWVCALGPDAVKDFSQPIALAEAVVRAAPPKGKHGPLNTLGAVLVRAGRYRDAIARLDEGIAAGGDNGIDLDWLFLALAYHHLGETAKARQYLARVPAAAPMAPLNWDRLEVEVLRREVQQTLDRP